MRACLLILIVQVAACGDPPPHHVDAGAGIDAAGQPGTVAIVWEIIVDTQPAPCPAVATTATVHLAPEAGEVRTSSHPCVAGTILEENVEPGNYQVWIDLTDDSGATLHARSQTVDIVVDAGQEASVELRFDAYHGFIDASWTLETSTGAPTTCADAPPGVMAVAVDPDGAGNPVTGLYECVDGEAPDSVEGLTRADLGPNSVVIELRNDIDTIQYGSSAPFEVIVDYGNQVIPTGPVVVTLD